MTHKLDESTLAVLRDCLENGKRLREELRKLDLDSLVRQGILKPLRGGWYEVPGNIRDLPEAVGFIATEGGSTASGRPKIKLAKPGPILKALEKF